MVTDGAYALLDCGDGRRLEAFGPLVVDRPAPTAREPRRDPGRWAGAIVYRGGRGWAASDAGPPPDGEETVSLAGVVLTAALAPGGQVGVFAEHAANGPWLRAAIGRRHATADAAGPEVLNLFAYTGLLSLVAASAGARVAHVDASAPAVAWARRNASAAGLDQLPIRWLVDDALGFVRREARRGRRYAGLILDPPSYGHGGAHGQGGAWQFETGIDGLLDACREIASPDAFWLLTTHTPGWDGTRLGSRLASALGLAGNAVDGMALKIDAASGAVLPLGAAARLDPTRSDPR